MKIRVSGTKAECELAQEYYKEFATNNECVNPALWLTSCSYGGSVIIKSILLSGICLINS